MKLGKLMSLMKCREKFEMVLNLKNLRKVPSKRKKVVWRTKKIVLDEDAKISKEVKPLVVDLWIWKHRLRSSSVFSMINKK